MTLCTVGVQHTGGAHIVVADLATCTVGGLSTIACFAATIEAELSSATLFVVGAG